MMPQRTVWKRLILHNSSKAFFVVNDILQAIGSQLTRQTAHVTIACAEVKNECRIAACRTS